MSNKIKSGSILVNPVDLAQGSVQDLLEDRSAYLRSDDLVTWSGAALTFTADIVLEILNTADGTLTEHKVDFTATQPGEGASGTITLADGESAYIAIDRTSASETVAIVNSGTTPIPAHSSANKDIFVLFKRKDASGAAILHVPLLGLIYDVGETKRLGAGSATPVEAFNNVNEQLNGNLDHWNRQITIHHTNTAKNYLADRIYEFQNGEAAPPFDTDITVDRVATTDILGTQFVLRVTRAVGNENATGFIVGSSLETRDSVPLQGKVVNFSFMARKSAGYSPTSDLLDVKIITGTGTDENPAAIFTGTTNILVDTATLTADYQRFSFTATIPDTATQIKWEVRANHIGVAIADDAFLIGQIMLKEGAELANFSTKGVSIGHERMLCKRYYEKTYDEDKFEGSTTDPSNARFMKHADSGSSDRVYFHSSKFLVEKRAVPTVKIFNHRGDGLQNHLSRYNADNNNVLASLSLNSATTGIAGFVTLSAAESETTWGVHWTIDAEL